MATLTGNSVKDTRFKININMTPIDGFNLGNTEWEATVFVGDGYKSITLKKEDCKMVDDDNYIIPIDSAILGAGTYFITLKVSIPDSDFSDGIRIEKRTGPTGVTIDAR
jgi:hypothetical protein